MASCFCGCGREISGMRRRAANMTGEEMSEQLAVLAAAADSGRDDGPPVRARSMVEEGRPLVASVTALVHEEISRRDFDKRAALDWLGRAKQLRRSLVAAQPGPAWRPDEPSTDVIAATGVRASGVVVRVEKNGWGNERVADLRVAVRLDDGQSLERSLSVPVREAPREGDRVEVAHDPEDSSRFVYRPALSPAADGTVAELSELARLYEDGLLTREEFEAQKVRLLGDRRDR